MPRSASSASIAAASRRLARRNAAFRRLPSRLSVVSYGNGHVRLTSASRVSLMNASIDLDGELRRDFAGRVAAHAVGDEVEAEIGARAVGVLVALPAQARMGRDRRGDAHHERQPRGRWLRATLEARDGAQQRDARALEVHVRRSASPAAPRRAAWPPRRAATSMSSARSATCARIDTRSRQRPRRSRRRRTRSASRCPSGTTSRPVAAPRAAARDPAGRRNSRLRPASRPRPRLRGRARARASRTPGGGASGIAMPTAAPCAARPLRRSCRPGRTPAPGISSCLPSTISLKPRTVSAIGTYLPL